MKFFLTALVLAQSAYGASAAAGVVSVENKTKQTFNFSFQTYEETRRAQCMILRHENHHHLRGGGKGEGQMNHTTHQKEHHTNQLKDLSECDRKEVCAKLCKGAVAFVNASSLKEVVVEP